MHGLATLHRSSVPTDSRCRGRSVPSWCGRAVRCFGCERGALGAGRHHGRHRRGQAAGRRHTLASHRGVQQRHSSRRGSAERYQPGGAGRPAANRARRFVRGQHRLALPGPPRHDLQKKRRTPPSRSGPTSQPGARPGSPPSLTLIRSAWSPSTRPAPRPRWPGCAAARPIEAGRAQPQSLRRLHYPAGIAAISAAP